MQPPSASSSPDSAVADTERTIVAGGGPAGLTAAYELAKLGRSGVVFEADEQVGGISRSVVFEGCRMDIGGHRFFTKAKEVEALWHEILGDDLLTRERMSRIFYRDTFFDYPLKPLNALRGLGPFEAVRVGLSYVYAQLFPESDETTFDAWVSNRFGRRLFEIFFETYTEKVWGMPCSEISAAWAAQRIKNLNLMTALKNAFLRQGTRDGEVVTSLIESFLYPRLGPGMMWERCSELAAERGFPTQLNSRVVRIHHENGRVSAVDVQGTAAGDSPNDVRTEACDSLVSSMPVGQLVLAMDPPPPDAVREAAEGLRYRDFLIIGLIVDRDHLFPDNWIYIHSPGVRVGRVQNFKNWSPEMVADPATSFIGLEYFVNAGDDLWSMDDEALIELGAAEAQKIGLFEAGEVRAGNVVRMPKAYPVYDDQYEAHLATLRGWLDGFENLYTVGRNGQHRYNNQDHSMLAGLFAARNLTGSDYDLWSINEEESFHEEVRQDELEEQEGEQKSAGGVQDRLTPSRTESQAERLLRQAFARYDEVALGGAVGITAALVLTAATLLLIFSPDKSLAPMLSLLSNYVFGFELSWTGLLVGVAGVGAYGFGLGWVTARLANLLISISQRNLERQLVTLTTVEAMDEGDVEIN
ncbi:MAG: NAD(P)/FAD-dependent oxidoreductase [Acidobacteriota bacterium]